MLTGAIRTAILSAVHDIFFDNRYADKAIEFALQREKWEDSERGIIAEAVYDVVRRWRQLWWLMGEEPRDRASSLRRLLATWAAITKQKAQHFKELDEIDRVELWAKYNGLTDRSLRYSMPHWLDALGERELGAENWEREIRALQYPAPQILRINTLKISKEEFKQKLDQKGIEVLEIEGCPDALQLRRKANTFAWPEWNEGFLEIQDSASQCVAPFLKAEAGMRIVDACAGAGGKTLHLAALLQNKGRIVAMDVDERKLDSLRKRARRAGATNIEIRPIEDNKTLKRLHGTADRLLLDVPCSGLGVLRRNPDSKWHLNPDRIEELHRTQAHILQNYAPILDTNGELVYATCSILPSENQDQVQRFLKNNPNFELLEERHFLPSQGYDGFYMARLRKN